jgi:hypothetical protein
MTLQIRLERTEYAPIAQMILPAVLPALIEVRDASLQYRVNVATTTTLQKS